MAEKTELENELENLKNILLEKYSNEIVEIFINYCCEEEYGLANIEEDIAEQEDSLIYEHMQTENNWDDHNIQCFIHYLGQAINPIDDDNNDNQDNIHQDNEDSDDILEGIYDVEEEEEKQEKEDDEDNEQFQVVLDQLQNNYNYKPEIIQIFKDFCEEQEVLFLLHYAYYISMFVL